MIVRHDIFTMYFTHSIINFFFLSYGTMEYASWIYLATRHFISCTISQLYNGLWWNIICIQINIKYHLISKENIFEREKWLLFTIFYSVAIFAQNSHFNFLSASWSQTHIVYTKIINHHAGNFSLRISL